MLLEWTKIKDLFPSGEGYVVFRNIADPKRFELWHYPSGKYITQNNYREIKTSTDNFTYGGTINAWTMEAICLNEGLFYFLSMVLLNTPSEEVKTLVAKAALEAINRQLNKENNDE